MRHSVIPPGQGPTYDWTSDHVVVKTPMEVTDGRATLVEDTLKPGFFLARHHHRVMVEVFYILDGEVTFRFDDETVVASPGTTVNVPPQVWHEVTCIEGGRLLTLFSPGGFDHYLSELAGLEPGRFDDAAFMEALNRQYDIWSQ